MAPQTEYYPLSQTSPAVVYRDAVSPTLHQRRGSTGSADGDTDRYRRPSSSASRLPTPRYRRVLTYTIVLGLILVAYSHISGLYTLPTDLIHANLRSPSLRHGKGAVYRGNNITLEQYLRTQFKPDDVVYWTVATENYVEPLRNWDAKRAELGMPDNVMVLCLDEGCLDRVEEIGGRAYGGYLSQFVDLPPPSTKESHKEKRSGAERGHYMSYVKFTTLIDMNKSGFSSLFFEGDTFILEDPFDHMLPLSRPDWDMQFTEDMGALMNFGWIFARPSKPTIAFWEFARDRYVSENKWDQLLVSGLIRELEIEEINHMHKRSIDAAGVVEEGETKRDMDGDVVEEVDEALASDHWWILGVKGLKLRVHMLPATKFLAQHVITMGIRKLAETSPDPNVVMPIMRHLSAVQWPSRMFWPKEKGWFANLDGYYTTPTPFLTTPPFSGTGEDLSIIAGVLSSVAYATNSSFMVPDEVTLFKDGQAYHRDYTRILSTWAAMLQRTLELREAKFFDHAKKYLKPSVYKEWTSTEHRLHVDLREFKNARDLVTFINALPVDPMRVVDLRYLGQSDILKWQLHDLVEVPNKLKKIRLCKQPEPVHQPEGWCRDW